MGTSTGFVIFRALVFPPFGVQGLHLCRLWFFFFSGSGFCISWYPRCVSFQAPFSGSGFYTFRHLRCVSFRAPVFLFFGVRGLHVCGLQFSFFRAPVSAFLGTRGVHLFGLRFFYFSGSGFCTFRHPRCAFLRALVFLFFGSDCHWGFPGLPVPLPQQTCTHHQG